MAGAFVPFDDQPTLNGVLVTGIETMGDSTLVATPDGVTVVTVADQRKILMTFAEGSDQRHKDVANVQFDPLLMNGVWKEVQPFPVNWQKSGVRMLDNLSAALLSIPVLVHYRYPEDRIG
jgi:hypothetical protein